MYNILFCSVGRRGTLLKNVKYSLQGQGFIIATDNSNTAPALYYADKSYIVPKINDADYIFIILDICQKENIKAITSLIDPEITVLAKHKNIFDSEGILLLTPSVETAELCFDKYAMYEYLSEHNINTAETYKSLEEFNIAFENKLIDFPVFIKPRRGSGSVGAKKISSMDELKSCYDHPNDLIIQEFMDGLDIDADVYVDCGNKEVVSIFAKRKLETKIGGANKTISFKDNRLFDMVKNINKKFEFCGPVDMDFFYKDGEYYLSEINPRFGGAYIHAYGSGVDFVPFIINNLNNMENTPAIGNYPDNTVMMMYDDVVIRKKEELI